MSQHIFGAHMPTTGGLTSAIKEAQRIGCDAVQLFTSSPYQWQRKPLEESVIQEFKQAYKASDLKQLVSHDIYIVNLCSLELESQEKSVRSIIDNMKRCSQLGIPYLVSHIGAHMNQGEEAAIHIITKHIQTILKETPEDVILCMENTAGQGSTMNYKFEHLSQIIEGCKGDPRLGICFDTCHAFGAGYDLRTLESYDHTFSEAERLIGIDRIKVIHCNDSKKPLGSKVDRHEHLGKGEIGEDAFRLLVNDPRCYNIPIILETPEPKKMHETNLQKLRSLVKK